MLDLLGQCFPVLMNEWNPLIKEMIPSHGEDLAKVELVDASRARTTKVLKILD
ncbi:MAG: malate:quinone oxidoreductase [Algoriella sp.]